MISVGSAHQSIVGHPLSLECERLPLKDLVGRVLSSDIVATQKLTAL